MFGSIQHFISIRESETASTLACFHNLTVGSLSKEPVHGYRTLERLANHIVDCAAGIPHEAGLPVAGYQKQHYGSASAIAETYTKLVLDGLEFGITNFFYF